MFWNLLNSSMVLILLPFVIYKSFFVNFGNFCILILLETGTSNSLSCCLFFYKGFRKRYLILIIVISFFYFLSLMVVVAHLSVVPKILCSYSFCCSLQEMEFLQILEGIRSDIVMVLPYIWLCHMWKTCSDSFPHMCYHIYITSVSIIFKNLWWLINVQISSRLV